MLPGIASAVGALPSRRGRLIETLTALGLTADLKLCLDASDSASYTSGQKWLDRSGGGYDFFLGADGSATATDPTFNGAAGGQSGQEFWSFDGGDYFTYDTSNETWMQAPHKDGAAFTVLSWIRLSSGGSGGVFSTMLPSNADIGIDFAAGSTSVRFSVGNGSGSSFAFGGSYEVGGAFDGRWSMFALSVNEGANTFTIFVNGKVQVSGACTYSSPSASNASRTLKLGADGFALLPLTNGSRMASLAAWSAALSTAQLGSIYAWTRGKFGVV